MIKDRHDNVHLVWDVHHFVMAMFYLSKYVEFDDRNMPEVERLWFDLGRVNQGERRAHLASTWGTWRLKSLTTPSPAWTHRVLVFYGTSVYEPDGHIRSWSRYPPVLARIDARRKHLGYIDFSAKAMHRGDTVMFKRSEPWTTRAYQDAMIMVKLITSGDGRNIIDPLVNDPPGWWTRIA